MSAGRKPVCLVCILGTTGVSVTADLLLGKCKCSRNPASGVQLRAGGSHSRSCSPGVRRHPPCASARWRTRDQHLAQQAGHRGRVQKWPPGHRRYVGLQQQTSLRLEHCPTVNSTGLGRSILSSWNCRSWSSCKPIIWQPKDEGIRKVLLLCATHKISSVWTTPRCQSQCNTTHNFEIPHSGIPAQCAKRALSSARVFKSRGHS